MTIEQIRNKLEHELSPKRYTHSVNVMKTAIELAAKYGVDVKKAEMAGILHDCARNIKGEEALRLCRKFGIDVDNISKIQTELLHGPLGSVLAREEYGIEDESVLAAICWHTTGRENMDMLEKIIFTADFIEPGRKFAGVEDVRKQAFIDISKAVLMSLDCTIHYVIAKGALIHPATIHARNYIILNG
ncbi:MAG: bis(5'-nucleosyl)-tetraphosphatase (symmetrical) YqeK [Clostridiales bacterium]|jgi:predicted HD superfamily hydrolase involved in NAD metabolism|nr:bis(5'-nucleosyl)-tetraphosphatase (symmetrical) YqeK [Eubacteriales bacterium]MDH7565556.1 bis(5'-nucleosyl)-tetraphosphatase (symmetrical) YqeK [Clostridiales bacterium]